MAPAPAPVPVPAMAVGDEGGGERGAKHHNNSVVLNSEDVSMGAGKDDGDLPSSCSELDSGHLELPPEVEEDKGGDTTECSSSFGGTCSGFEDEADGGEAEVNSHISAPADGDQASRPPRRKKVTAEWRNTVSPILWRCQWLELRMKDITSQVSKYDRELALIKKEKELQQAVSKTNGSMPESMLIAKDYRNTIMKRRKRKKDEDIVDTSLYIKKHHILSYYNDKQNKGAEADGLLPDDDCSSPADGPMTAGFNTVSLLAEESDMIFEQVALQDILLKIDGVQSQVRLLQDRLSKAHLQEDKTAFSDDNTHVRVPRKRQSTQKFYDTYTKNQDTKPQKYRNTRPQKRKNLNILLKDDDGPALAVKPALPDRETNCQIEDAKKNCREKGSEWNRSQDRSITMDLLLGVDNSLPNGHIIDLFKDNADDALIDNQAANEGCPQLEKVEHLPSETSSKGQNMSAQVEVKKTSAPVLVDGISPPLEVDSTSAPVVNHEPLLEKPPMMKPVKKRGWIPKKENKGWGSASSSINQSKGTYTTPDSKQKTKSTPPRVKEKADSSASDAMDPEIMTPLSALKKRKIGISSAASEERKAGNSSTASEKQRIGKSSSAAKKRKTENSPSATKQENENSSAAARKQETENSSPAIKKQETINSSPAAKKQATESSVSKLSTQTPSKLMVEKAVLVAVNSRRSQRVRKPKVY